MHHETWRDAKIQMGYHAPADCDSSGGGRTLQGEPCVRCHPSLVAWVDLPDPERTILRFAADRLLGAVAALIELPAAATVDTSTTALDAVLAELRKPKDAKA